MELEQQQAILRLVLDSMVGGVLVFDITGKMLLSNRAAKEILPRHTAAGTIDEVFAMYRLYDVDTVTPIASDDLPSARALRGETIDARDFFVRAADVPGNLWLTVSVRPLDPDIARVQSAMILFRDTTWQKQAEVALRASEEGFRRAFDDAAIGMALVDLDGRFLQVNQSLCDITGYSEHELLATTFQAITYPDDLKADLSYMRQLLGGEIRTYQMEKRYIHKCGDVVWILLSGSLVRNDAGQPWYFIAQIQDITPRKAAEAALEESRRFANSIVETTPDMVYVLDLDRLRHVYENRTPAAVLGYTPAEVQAMGAMFGTLIRHPDDFPQLLDSVERLRRAQDNEVVETEFRLRRADGTWRWFYSRDVVFTRDVDGRVLQSVGIAQDITERKQADEQIRATLKEKEILLAEIHHRVKNNLQVISSLLKLQASQLRDPDVLELFRDSQHRVRSMALVHEKLYQTHDVAHIDFADYLKSLTDFLLRAYGERGGTIDLRISASKLPLDIERAVPLGLIINELVSNALKYAFPGSRGGEIMIDVQSDTGTLALTVRDNGIGLPDTLDVDRPQTLGLRLVHALVRQLHGSVRFFSDSGTTVVVSIKEGAL
ncbi:MAG TPA: PAS domain S-box protein [Herpetosiphonaceae bacterium]